MSAPPGFGAPPGFAGQPNGGPSSLERMDGDFFGTLSKEEIEKKARKWRAGQKRKFNEKRKAGGGGGIDFGKAVSSGGLYLKESS
jgi:pre-mRNA-processing factor 8